MINGAHVLLYAKDAGKTRAFFRDTLGMKHVNAGEGWLIFALPPAEMGIHPIMEEGGEEMHELYFMCDDVEKTVAELKAKGVEVTQPIRDQGWGLVTAFRIPGGGDIGLYQPRHPLAATIAAAPKAASKKRGKQKASGSMAKKKPAKRSSKRVSRGARK